MSVDMNEKEMINNLIDKYTDLQRIKTAEDSEREIDYQLGFKSKTGIFWYYYK